MKKLVIICISIVTPILIIGLVGIILFFDYKKVELEEQKETERLELKQKQEKDNQIKLKTCIEGAENNRKALWRANCPDDNSNCSLYQNTIDWIDSRYNQDIKNCNSLYN